MTAGEGVLAVMRRDATDAARLRSQQDTAYSLRRLPESDEAHAAAKELRDAAADMRVGERSEERWDRLRDALLRFDGGAR